MKICPKCSATYQDDNLNYCLNDGTALEFSPQAATVEIGAAWPTDPPYVMQGRPVPMQFASNHVSQPKKGRSKGVIAWVSGIIIAVLLLCGGGIGGFLLLVTKNTPNKDDNDPPVRTAEPKKTIEKPSTTTSDQKGEYELSMDKYNKIKVGMARSDVENILGGTGTEISSSTGGGMTFSVNKWEGERFHSIILSFKNDKVMSKSQVGLR